MSNSYGKIFRITSFGESHGSCIGIIIDGCPVGLPLNEDDIQPEVDKRKPSGKTSTSRIESDKVEILSGVFDGHTTGAPLTMMIRNENTDSGAYEKTKYLLRPGHADYTGYVKYCAQADYRGGGRFSGRNTAGFVMAGAVAKKLLAIFGIEILAHTVEVGGIKAESKNIAEIRTNTGQDPMRCADPEASKKMLLVAEQAKEQGDSVGGIIEATVINLPVGLGEPMFDTLEGEIAKSLFAIPAVKGVEFGAGFAVARMKGSENNDPFTVVDGQIKTTTNNAGGILGGISNGMPLVVRAAVKPTPSIALKQDTVNIETMENAPLEIKGRHDACIVPRAVPVVEAMIAVTLCDFALRAEVLPEEV